MALFKSAARRPARCRRSPGPKSANPRPGRARPQFHTGPAQASLARTMPVKGGTKCIKYLLFGFNFIFWVSERQPPRAPLRSHLFIPGTLSAVEAAGNWHSPRRVDSGREETRHRGRQLAPRPGPETSGASTIGRGSSEPEPGSGAPGALGSWGGETGPSPLFRRGFGAGFASAPSPPPAPPSAEGEGCREKRSTLLLGT